MNIIEEIKKLPYSEDLFWGSGYDGISVTFDTDNLKALAESHERLLETCRDIVRPGLVNYDLVHEAIEQAEKMNGEHN